MTQYQVKIPQGYDPTISINFFKPRGCWRYNCLLPTKERIAYVGYLPKKIYKTERQAKSFRDQKRDDLKKGILNEKEYEKVLEASPTIDLTFEDALEEYFDLTKITKTPRTLNNERKLYPFIFSFFKENYEFDLIKQVKQTHILKYKENLLKKASLRKEILDLLKPMLKTAQTKEEKISITKKIRESGISPATAQNYFKHVLKLFNKLYQSGKILSNPVEGLTMLKISTSDAVRSRTFDPQDLVKITSSKYVHPEGFPMMLFVLFLAETGARKGEGLHLEWPDLNFDTRMWKVREKPECPTNEKIGWKPKWGKERSIYLSDTAVDILRLIPKVESVGHVIVGMKKDLKGRKVNVKKPVPANFVFTVKDEATGLHRRVDNIRKAWKTFLYQAGVGDVGFDQFVMHDFRRYKNVINECIHNMSLRQRSEQLGNTERINSTHYSGLASNDLIKTKGQIQNLTAKNMQLEAQIRMLEEENQKLKDRPMVS